MNEGHSAHRTLSAALALLTLLLSVVGLSIVHSGASSGAQSTASATGKKAATATTTTASAAIPNAYRGMTIPRLPAGINPLLSDVGPSATSRPKLPIGRTTRVVSVSDLDGLSAALKTATPGTAIELRDGTYEGELEVTANGTATTPIVIRSARAQGARFIGKTQIRLLGRYTVLDGLLFDRTGASTLEIAGMGNRVTNSMFQECGDGSSGSSAGLILLDNPAPDGYSDPDGLARPLVDRRAMVDSNTFVRPLNTVIWQNHGLQGNSYIGNRIIGPHGIKEGESEAIKIGFGFGAESTKTVISYNEITDWEGWPYVIGIKSSNVELTANVLSKGRLEVRYGNSVTLRRNVVLNGDMFIGGNGHTVSGNVVLSSTSRDRLGPLIVSGTGSTVSDLGSYDGTTKPIYYRAMTNSTISDNTFVSLDPDEAGTVFMLGLVDAVWSAPPRGNTFSRNVFLRTSGPTQFLGAAGNPAPTEDYLRSVNRWSSNVFMCAGVCTQSEISVPGIVGTGSNVASDVAHGLKTAAGANPSTFIRSAKQTPTPRSARPTTTRLKTSTKK